MRPVSAEPANPHPAPLEASTSKPSQPRGQNLSSHLLVTIAALYRAHARRKRTRTQALESLAKGRLPLTLDELEAHSLDIVYENVQYTFQAHWLSHTDLRLTVRALGGGRT